MTKIKNRDNVMDKLNLIMINLPNNLSTIEKIRWIYIKTGEVFSYDFRVVTNMDYAKVKIDFENDYISKYETCVQIAEVFNIMLNYIDGCESKVIERIANVRGIQGENHVANEVTLSTGECFILDLTLDLYLIQSGCQTRQFGYDSSPNKNYDIISLVECRNMDNKLGLIKNERYTDEVIEELKGDLNKKTYQNDAEKIEDIISDISKIIPSFNGYHEGKQFVNKLFLDLLPYSYKEFNLTYINGDEMELLTCFRILNVWYLYDSKLGLISTNLSNLKEMLSGGWTTRSNELMSELGSSYIKK